MMGKFQILNRNFVSRIFYMNTFFSNAADYENSWWANSKSFKNLNLSSWMLYIRIFCTGVRLTMKISNNKTGRCFFHCLIQEILWFQSKLNILILFQQMRSLKTRALDESWKDFKTAFLRYEYSCRTFDSLSCRSSSRSF